MTVVDMLVTSVLIEFLCLAVIMLYFKGDNP